MVRQGETASHIGHDRILTAPGAYFEGFAIRVMSGWRELVVNTDALERTRSAVAMSEGRDATANCNCKVRPDHIDRHIHRNLCPIATRLIPLLAVHLSE